MATLKQRREALGLTLRDVERITDGKVSNAYLSQLENGKIKNPSLAVGCMLAAAYALTLAEVSEMVGGIPVIEPTPICPTCGQAMLGGPNVP